MARIVLILLACVCMCSSYLFEKSSLYSVKRNLSTTNIKNHFSNVDTLIIGSGLTGSTAAFYLNREGVDVKVAESSEFVGGNVVTKSADGYQWEEGPNSFQPTPTILRFVKDVGMLEELVLADPTLPRFVFWDNELKALPSGLKDLPSFSLLSLGGKVRAGLGMLGLIAGKPDHEESIQEFATRHLGKEVFERVIDPFVSGVYAGDPRALSMAAALKKIKNLEDMGSSRGLLSGVFVRMKQLSAEKKARNVTDADLPQVPSGSLGSFRRGMQSLTDKVQQLLGSERVLLRHKLVRLEREGGDYVCTFEVGSASGDKSMQVIHCKSLILAIPAFAAATLLGGESGLLPTAASLLERVQYPPVAVAVLAYPDSDLKVPLRGFGHLIPRCTGVRTLGTIWTSSLFPGRAPAGYTLLNNFIGGAQDPGILSLTPAQIVENVHRDNLKIILKPDAAPPKVLAVRLWSRSIPQYQRGHLELLSGVHREAAERCPGLFVGGNFNTGVAVGDCIQYGVDIAKEVASFLRRPQQESSHHHRQ